MAALSNYSFRFALPDEVHLWTATATAAQAAELAPLLSSDELERADRFRFDADRHTFICGRGMLRTLLGRYLGQQPESLDFSYNSQQKPFLANHRLAFNLSHSGGKLLLGITPDHAIGVDIEDHHRKVEVEAIVGSFFSANEIARVLALPAEQRKPAFFRCWTRKEAFIKAKGGGLNIPLDQFEVSLLAGEPAALKSIEWDEQDVANWSMISLRNAAFTAAAIVHNPDALWRFMEWPPPSNAIDPHTGPSNQWHLHTR